MCLYSPRIHVHANVVYLRELCSKEESHNDYEQLGRLVGVLAPGVLHLLHLSSLELGRVSSSLQMKKVERALAEGWHLEGPWAGLRVTSPGTWLL